MSNFIPPDPRDLPDSPGRHVSLSSRPPLSAGLDATPSIPPVRGAIRNARPLPSVPAPPFDTRAPSATPAPQSRADMQLPWELGYEDRYPMKDPSSYTEFEKKYPPDRYGEEASDNARVWKMYRDGASERDEDVVDGWNKTLDILLIFTGLFSAMATAFIIEAYKQLSPDFTEYIALAYISVHTNSSAPMQLPANFVASKTALWTNGLWFASLGLALLVALLAILAKQWLAEYSSRMRAPVASQRQWVCRHRVYNSGLTKWGLDVFISILPVGLHLALFLFFTGLVVFLLDVSIALSAFIGSGVAFAGLFYLAATLAPLWFGDCPTATPLTRYSERQIHALLNAIRHRLRFAVDYSPPTFDEAALIGSRKPERLHVEALTEIVETSPSDEEVRVAVEAVGGLVPSSHQAFLTSSRAIPLRVVCQQRLINILYRDRLSSDALGAARAVRAALCAKLTLDGEDRKAIQQRYGRTQTFDLVFISMWLSFDDRDLSHIASAMDTADPSAESNWGVLPSSVDLILLCGQVKQHSAEFAHVLALLYALSLPTSGQYRSAWDSGRQAHATLKELTDVVLQSVHMDAPTRHYIGFAVAWGKICSSPSVSVAHKKYFRQAYTATLRFLAKERYCLSWLDLELCLSYCVTADLDHWHIGDLEAALTIVRWASAFEQKSKWTAELGHILRVLLWRYSLKSSDDTLLTSVAASLASGFLLDTVGYSSCRSAVYFIDKSETVPDAMANSVVNLLTTNADDGIPSAWATLTRSQSHGPVSLASVIARHLYIAYRRGGNVKSFMDTFISALDFRTFVEEDGDGAADIAIHLKEISDTWWSDLCRELTAEDHWQMRLYRTAQSFIDNVNRRGHCSECSHAILLSTAAPRLVDRISIASTLDMVPVRRVPPSLLQRFRRVFGRAPQANAAPLQVHANSSSHLELGEFSVAI